MIKLKHTPGPWNYIPPIDDDDDVLIIDKRRQWIATLTPRIGILDNEANARLIAAAPEMLEKLIELYTIFLVVQKDCYRIPVKDIIEKATGQKIEDLL